MSLPTWRVWRSWVPLLALLLALMLPAGSVSAVSLSDLPAVPPESHVLDTADVLSRASRAEIDNQLRSLESDRVDGRLITLNHLDYGLDLNQLAGQLLQRWSDAAGQGSQPLLMLLIDTQNKATTIVTSAELERQLPPSLLTSTARTTMAQPLREGDRYRQASVDAITRLTTVLQGGEDPGEPVVPEVAVAVTNIPSAEETREGNGLTWVVVLLVVGSVVPMATWWIFSR